MIDESSYRVRRFSIEKSISRDNNEEDNSDIEDSPDISTKVLLRAIQSMQCDLDTIKQTIKSISEKVFLDNAERPKSSNTAESISNTTESKLVEHINEDRDLGLRFEFSQVIRALVKAKTELAKLNARTSKESQIQRASWELDEVVQETEQATKTILQSVESIEKCILSLDSIDDKTNFLASREQIIQHITKIFEACNFQDITGQRVRKVMRTLTFIEERVKSMIDIWGIEAFSNIPVPPNHDTQDTLLNGPQLANQGLTQDEIDQLFH